MMNKIICVYGIIFSFIGNRQYNRFLMNCDIRNPGLTDLDCQANNRDNDKGISLNQALVSERII